MYFLFVCLQIEEVRGFINGDEDPLLAIERGEKLKTNGKEVIHEIGRTLMKSR